MFQTESFVAALPKVDPHVHLIGSARPETVAELARHHPDSGVPTDTAALRDFLRFTDLDHFGRVYGAISRLVTTGTDLTTLVTGLAVRLAADNVRYAEVTVTPSAHLAAGIDATELADSLAAGRRIAAVRHGVRLAWVFDISGDLGPESGLATVRWIRNHAPPGTVALGLGGPENGAPRTLFRAAFDRARAAGLHSVPHAGETTDAAEVWSAVRDLGAERVGHGIRGVRDPALLRELAERQIPLEVCLTSNLRTGAVAAAADHPLPELLAAGVPVALGTDDPGLFGTSLSQEYLLCERIWGASRHDLAELARAAVRAVYCAEELRRTLLAGIDAVENGHRAADGTDPW